jgi:hypothetical protein
MLIAGQDNGEATCLGKGVVFICATLEVWLEQHASATQNGVSGHGVFDVHQWS